VLDAAFEEQPRTLLCLPEGHWASGVFGDRDE